MTRPHLAGTTARPAYIVVADIATKQRYWLANHGTGWFNDTVFVVEHAGHDEAAFAHERDRLGASALFPTIRT